MIEQRENYFSIDIDSIIASLYPYFSLSNVDGILHAEVHDLNNETFVKMHYIFIQNIQNQSRYQYVNIFLCNYVKL